MTTRVDLAVLGTDGTVGGPGGSPLSGGGGAGGGTGNVTDRGAWAASTVYNLHDLVEYGGTDFLCALAHTSGAAFDTTKWTELNQYRGAWQANKVYEAGDTVASGGLLYSANSNFTSGASFNAANWTQISGSGGTTPSIQGAQGTNFGATQTINFGGSGSSNIWLYGTLNTNLVVTVSGLAAGARARIFALQDATGGRTLTVAGQTVAIASAANAFTMVEVNTDGTNVDVSPFGGSAGVASVAAADTSVVVGGTAIAPTLATGTLDVIAADHPPAADWSNNSHKITSLASGVASTDAATIGQLPAVAKTRRVSLPIGADNSLSQSGFTDLLQRYPITLPVTPTRCRLRIGNAGISFSGSITLSDLYIGTPVYSSGVWNGVIAASPTDVLALGGTMLPVDGSDLVTSWFTPPAAWKADTEVVLSLGATPSASTITLTKGANTGFLWYMTSGTGVSGDVAVGTPTHGSTVTSSPFLDVRLEYEVSTALPVGLFVGDSLMAADEGTVDAQVVGPMATWPAMAAMLGRFLWINGGVGGSGVSNWTSGSYRGWTRIQAWLEGDIGTANGVPDFAVIALGVNDANTGTTKSTFQTNLQTTIGLLQGFGIQRIYVVTPFPQGRFKPGTVVVGQAAASTTIQTSIPYANADVIDIDYEFSSLKETRTVSGASVLSTPGNYTTTVTVATSNAHQQGASVGISGTESRRKDYVQVIRQGPGGVTGIIDAARLLSLAGSRDSVPDPVLYNVAPPDITSIHPVFEAYSVLAQAGAVLGA